MRQWNSYLTLSDRLTGAPYGLVIAGGWLGVHPDESTTFDLREIAGWFSGAIVCAELRNIEQDFFNGLDYTNSSVMGIVTSDDYDDIKTIRQYIGIAPTFENTHARSGAEAIHVDGGDVIFVTLYDDGQRQAIQRFPGTEYEPLLWISDFRAYPEIAYDPTIIKIDFNSTLFSGSLDDYLEGRMDHEVYVTGANGRLEKTISGRNWYRMNEEYFSTHPSALEAWKTAPRPAADESNVDRSDGDSDGREG